MNAIMEYFTRIKAGLITLAGMIAIGGGIMTIPTYVATPADLKQMKTEIVTEFNKSMALERDISRLNNISDSLIKAKIQLRQYPKDVDLKEDVDSLKSEKEKLQRRIEKR